jgi:hypothetical protein
MNLAQQMLSALDKVVAGSRAGIHVVNTATGEVLADRNANEQFYTASLVKLLIAVDAFHSQNWNPDANTSAQVSRMLSYSDDNIADQFWDDNGGNSIVTRAAQLIGLRGTQPPSVLGMWGETLVTANDIVTVYHYLAHVAPETAGVTILTALRSAARIAADGTNQYFGIPDGLRGFHRAIKQGWMSLDSGTTMNTTGLVGADEQYTVVVLSSQPAGISWTTGGDALTAAIDALRPALQN